MDLMREQIEYLRIVWGKEADGQISRLCDMALRAVPEGWQAVPKEPTEAMLRLGVHAMQFGYDEDSASDMRDGYRAMLAAAPKLMS